MKRIKKIKLLFLILIICTMFFNGFKHQKSPTIIEVSNSEQCGDKGGGFYKKIVRKDSTYIISGSRGREKSIKQYKTDSVKWNKLIRILNVDDFKNIKSKEIDYSVLQHDGCISIYSLKTLDSLYVKPISSFPIEMTKVDELYNEM